MRPIFFGRENSTQFRKQAAGNLALGSVIDPNQDSQIFCLLDIKGAVPFKSNVLWSSHSMTNAY